MRSKTKKAERVRKYYLELEKLLDKYKDYIIDELSKQYKLVLDNQKPKNYPTKGVIYVIQTADDVTLYKIGKSVNMKNRIRSYNADKANDIRPILIYETENPDSVESCIKNAIKKFKYRKYKEVYEVNIDILKEVINECDCSTQKLSLITKNKPLNQTGGNLFLMFDK